jgi:hypothetical protein
MGPLAAVLAGLMLGSMPGPEPSAVSEVSWTAPRGCPTQSAIVAGVETLLGEPLTSPRAVVVRAEGRVEQSEDRRWVLRLRVRSPTGVRDRVLEGATCQELGEVAVVLVAVAIDPSVDVSEPPEDLVNAPDEGADEDVAEDTDEPEPEPEEPEPVELELELEGTVVPSTARDGALRGFASLATGLLIGPLPGVAPGLRLSLGLRWRLLAIGIGGSHWFERRTRLPTASDLGGDLRLTTGDVRVCAIPSIRRLELPLCTGAELGSLAGRGVGVANPRRGRALWAAWVADAGVIFMPWRWVGFGARATLVVPLMRSTFALDDIGPVHDVAPVGFQGLAGIELRFP